MDVSPAPEIYQLRFYVTGISPMIWRRLLIRSDSTLADLHYAIQIVMNWSKWENPSNGTKNRSKQSSNIVNKLNIAARTTSYPVRRLAPYGKNRASTS